MATTITLQGPRTTAARRFFRNLVPRPRRLGDAWTDDAVTAAAARPGGDAAGEGLATFAKAVIGWGVLAFAAWSAGIQIKRTWDRG